VAFAVMRAGPLVNPGMSRRLSGREMRTQVEIQFEQAGRVTRLFSTAAPGAAEMKQEGSDRG
jgi:hypothetical protein